MKPGVTQLQPIASARRLSTAGRCVVCGSLLGAATIVIVGVIDSVAGARLGMALAGVGALLSGATVIGFSRRLGRRGHKRRERPRLLLGAGVTVWGAGQVLVSMQVTATGQRTFGVADGVSALCMPILLLALISLPRRSRVSRPALRLTLDSLAVAGAVTLLVWRILLQPALPDPAHPGASAVLATGAALFDVGAAAISTLAWARDRRPGSLLVAAGMVLQAMADIWSLPAVLGNWPLPWVSGAIWCLAIPLATAGLIEYAVAPLASAEALAEDLGESRTTMIATVLALVVLVGTIALPVAHRWTPISIGLVVATVALLAIRETINSVARNRMLQWLHDEALRDVLTGLPNRSALTRRIRTLDDSQPWTLLTVDVDGFKEINDLLGPDSSDNLIMLVGTTLKRAAPTGCLVARTGGDEFGVLAPGTVEAGERLARQLSEAVHRTVVSQGGVPLSVSIGVGRVLPELDAQPRAGALGPEAPAVPKRSGSGRSSALLESAAALRAAKTAGRGKIVLYPGEVEQARHRRLLLEQRLRAALDAGTLSMHAQPLVDLGTGRVAGFESLARWTDEVLGPVSPAEFVPAAEQTGLITSLGKFALCSTLGEARAGEVFGRGVEIGVNVSPIQLRDPSFAPMVVDLVTELGLHPHQLLLEVTEAVLVTEGDPAASALDLLAGTGIQLAIDDFGTGYSALSYLRRLPIDVIKIDRSWVVAAVSDARTRDIVGGVVSLAHTLGTTVVMEGIEDETTADVCRELGADIGQGWLFGRPIPWPRAAAELAAAERAAADPEPAAPGDHNCRAGAISP